MLTTIRFGEGGIEFLMENHIVKLWHLSLPNDTGPMVII